MTEHAQGGGHGHAGHKPSSGRGLAVSAWLTGIYFIIEMGIGLWTGSIALISDAFHIFSARHIAIRRRLPADTGNVEREEKQAVHPCQ